MNINVNFSGVFLGAKVNETKNGVYRSIAIEHDGGCGDVSCTEEMLVVAKNLVKYEEYDFCAVYNTNYKGLRIVAIE